MSEAQPGGRERPGSPQAESETLFWDESWVRLEVDGSACVGGGACPGLRGASITGVRLPRIGEVRLPGSAAGRRQSWPASRC